MYKTTPENAIISAFTGSFLYIEKVHIKYISYALFLQLQDFHNEKNPPNQRLTGLFLYICHIFASPVISGHLTTTTNRLGLSLHYNT